LPADLIYSYTFEFDEDSDHHFTEQFEKLGIESINSIRAMGSAFIFLNIYLLIGVYLIIDGLILKIFPK
jgi:hypothetical protein